MPKGLINRFIETNCLHFTVIWGAEYVLQKINLKVFLTFGCSFLWYHSFYYWACPRLFQSLFFFKASYFQRTFFELVACFSY